MGQSVLCVQQQRAKKGLTHINTPPSILQPRLLHRGLVKETCKHFSLNIIHVLFTLPETSVVSRKELLRVAPDAGFPFQSLRVLLTICVSRMYECEPMMIHSLSMHIPLISLVTVDTAPVLHL